MSRSLSPCLPCLLSLFLLTPAAPVAANSDAPPPDEAGALRQASSVVAGSFLEALPPAIRHYDDQYDDAGRRVDYAEVVTPYRFRVHEVLHGEAVAASVSIYTVGGRLNGVVTPTTFQPPPAGQRVVLGLVPDTRQPGGYVAAHARVFPAASDAALTQLRERVTRLRAPARESPTQEPAAFQEGPSGPPTPAPEPEPGRELELASFVSGRLSPPLFSYRLGSPLRLSLDLDVPAELQVEAQDLEGRPLVELHPRAPRNAGSLVLEWNGLDAAGHRLPGPAYQLAIDVRSAEDSLLERVRVPFDNHAPRTQAVVAGSGRELRDGSELGPDEEILLRAHDGSGSGVARIEYGFADDPDWRVASGPLGAEELGARVLRYRAVDRLGHEEPPRRLDLRRRPRTAPRALPAPARAPREHTSAPERLSPRASLRPQPEAPTESPGPWLALAFAPLAALALALGLRLRRRRP